MKTISLQIRTLAGTSSSRIFTRKFTCLIYPAGPSLMRLRNYQLELKPVGINGRTLSAGPLNLNDLHAIERDFLSLFAEHAKRQHHDAEGVELCVQAFERLPGIVTGKAMSKGFLILKNGYKHPDLVKRQLKALCARATAIEHSNAVTNGGIRMVHVAVCLGSLRHLGADSPHTRTLLKFLASVIRRSDTSDVFLNHQLSNAMFGLRRMDSNVAVVRELMSALSRKIPYCRQPFSSQVISNALYGLQSMSSASVEVRELVTVLSEKISESSERLDAQDIGAALYGLQKMKSDSVEVQFLLSVLTERIADSDTYMEGLAIDNALYGLQSMTCKEPDVRRLLGILAKRIGDSACVLTPRHLSNALFGMQHMTAEVREARDLLEVLIKKAESCKDPFNPRQISVALYGIQNMGGEFLVSKQAVTFLAEKMEQCTEPFTEISFSNSVLGLKNMSSSSKEVNRLLGALSAKLRHPEAVLDGQGVGNMLFGLRHCQSDSAQCRELISALAPKVVSCRNGLSQADIGRSLSSFYSKDPTQDPALYDLLAALMPYIRECREKFTAQTISCMLHGLRGADPFHPAVVELLKIIQYKLDELTDAFSSEQIGNAFLGLQCMRVPASDALHGILSSLEPHVLRCTDMHPTDICCIYIGLQLMSTDMSDVLSLYKLAEEKLTQCMVQRSYKVSGEVICRILYSLRERDGCRHTLDTLKTIQIALSKNLDKLRPGDMCRAVAGLRRVGKHPEAAVIVEALADGIMSSNLTFETSDVAAAASGLATIDMSHPSAYSMLRSLSKRVQVINSNSEQWDRRTSWPIADLLAIVEVLGNSKDSNEHARGLLHEITKGISGGRDMMGKNLPLVSFDDVSFAVIQAKLKTLGQEGDAFLSALRELSYPDVVMPPRL